jgi:hypothetical protein
LRGEENADAQANSEKERLIHKTSSNAAHVLATPTAQSRPILKAFQFYRGDLETKKDAPDDDSLKRSEVKTDKSSGFAPSRGGMFERFASIAMNRLSGGMYTNISVLNEHEEQLRKNQLSRNVSSEKVSKSTISQELCNSFKSYIFDGEKVEETKEEDVQEEKMVWWV